MPRKIKKPAGPPPDASLLGIPPEMRNTIYKLVADDIDEVSIIGRKLDQSKATLKDHAWLWDVMAKHPLSQTCRQLRQEFDPVHRHRALTTGVTRYRLELENFDVDRITTFSKVIRYSPKIIRRKLKEDVNDFNSIIRFNLTHRVVASIRNLGKSWRGLRRIFSRLQRVLGVESINRLCSCHEVNFNFRQRTMSPAQNEFTPSQDQVARAKRDLKKIWKDINEEFRRNGSMTDDSDISGDNDDNMEQERRMVPVQKILQKLESTHKDYFKPLKEARAERASKALENKMRAQLRDELKAELRAEILSELKEETQMELASQIQEGLEGWSNVPSAERVYWDRVEGEKPVTET